MKKRHVGILIFDDVEILDFAGPYEVFSRVRLEPGVESRRSEETAPFVVRTISPTGQALRGTGGLGLQPDHGFADAPPVDVLLVPGGFGTRQLLEDATTLDWIRESAGNAELVTSVCTGALLLAQAGLLSGRSATTHWCALDLLAERGPETRVIRQQRFVHDGNVVTSAGVSAGIDMALYVVELLHGREVADETARYMEYVRQ